MSRIQDWITRTFKPSAYYAELAARTYGEPPTTANNVIKLQPWESPRNPAAPGEAKSATLGDTLPAAVAARAMASSFDVSQAVTKGLDASTWAFACMMLKADSGASVYWRADVWDVQTNKWIPEPNGALQALLDAPNDFMTTRQLVTRMILHLELSGNALLTKIRGGNGKVLELWPQDPRYVKVKLSKSDWITGYLLTSPGVSPIPVDSKDTVHFQYVDPSCAYWGRSPMKVLIDTLDTDNKAREWNKIAMDNRAVTDGVFTAANPLTQKQYDETKSQIREQHQGSKNAREPWLLSNGATWAPMALSPVEMDFINSRHFTREEICAVYRVPPPMIGIYDRATLNNVYTGRQTFWEDTMAPLCGSIAEQLTLELAGDFAGDGKRRRVWADTTDVPALQNAYASRLGLAERVIALGWPVDVAAERFELGLAAGVAVQPSSAAPRAAQEPAAGPPAEAVGAPDPADA